ncbi:MAG: hypothetical protein ACT4OF_16220 [Caulobacteraceae bacterium]
MIAARTAAAALVFSFALAAVAAAQPVVAPPANSHARAYGDGWQCDWICEHGFAKVALTCVAVIIPENAHMSAAGNAWECNQPHRRAADGCVIR